jgi:hypothetical protein
MQELQCFHALVSWWKITALITNTSLQHSYVGPCPSFEVYFIYAISWELILVLLSGDWLKLYRHLFSC